MATDYLDWALTDFSGYIAADELYDGPFCVLSIVDNRTYRRLFYRVLEHSPSQADIEDFFGCFQAVLQVRQLTIKGITTDGSSLYPVPIHTVWGAVPHQLCQFHILKDINRAVLGAVAHVRKSLVTRKPKLGRGRPTARTRKLVQHRERLEQKVADLFTHRHLFVQRQLTATEQDTLQQITRGLPQLRVLREIVEEVYRLFDRRCRTETALAKLNQLRQRVQRFIQLRQTLKTLFSTNLEKALTFLDDRLLPATSNAVERGNRRFRKMQKTVYSVRTQAQIIGRLALDMLRDTIAQGRHATLLLLHKLRIEPVLAQAQ